MVNPSWFALLWIAWPMIRGLFAIEFRMKRILHHGAEYKELFKSLEIDLGLLPTRNEKFTQTKRTLKEMPWNTTVTRSQRQLFFSKRKKQNLPNVTDQETILNLARMSYDAYLVPEQDGWLDLGKRYTPLEGFGWQTDGIRGYVFADEKEESIVLAFKGTSAGIISGDSPTSGKDKLNDNLMFSCCCARVDSTWHKVCDCYQRGYNCSQTCLDKVFQGNSPDVYYAAAHNILSAVQDAHPEAQLWLTGHSLGGGLSALLGLAYNIPTVTFQSPGDLLPASRLHLPGVNLLDFQDHIWHFGHNSDPIFMGQCQGVSSACYITGYALESKCHTGRVCTYDTQKEKDWGMDILKHRIGVVIAEVIEPWDGVPECVHESGCVDCPLWTYT
ncbi:putative lipase atg15 [Massospora cicadina]|nr:putative lipase atg15 [Massospora cicadina]